MRGLAVPTRCAELCRACSTTYGSTACMHLIGLNYNSCRLTLTEEEVTVMMLKPTRLGG